MATFITNCRASFVRTGIPIRIRRATDALAARSGRPIRHVHPQRFPSPMLDQDQCAPCSLARLWSRCQVESNAAQEDPAPRQFQRTIDRPVHLMDADCQ